MPVPATLLRCALGLALLITSSLAAPRLDVEEFRLDNGMKFLLVHKPGAVTVAAGWVSKFGSVNERPGVTGVAHLFEHMMFKGTTTIGTTDIDRDLQLIKEIDAVQSQIRTERETLLTRYRLGLIDDPDDPAHRSENHATLLTRFRDLLREQRSLLDKNAFINTYASHGAVGMNAATGHDFTSYFVTVPAHKLELWFWMESDRLANPVFREFYTERDVVLEERRLAVESTPTGKLDQQFEAMFWQSSPYGWPVIGWPSDIQSITREEASEYYSSYYAPGNLVAALVGDFETEDVQSLARRYFGRLASDKELPTPVRTREVPQQAEQRLIGEAESAPQVKIMYHAVPRGHVDEPALQVMAALLSGNTGRLQKSLVFDQRVSSGAFAWTDARKYDGAFGLHAVAAQGTTLDKLEEALLAEVDRLAREPVGYRELQTVKNQQLFRDYRNLLSKDSLLLDLLVREAQGEWRSINTDSALVKWVTPQDVLRVANQYFNRTNRSVAVYRTQQQGGTPELRQGAMQ